MKKLVAILLAVLFVVGASACKTASPSTPTASILPSISTITIPDEEMPSSKEPSSEESSSKPSSNQESSEPSSEEETSSPSSTPTPETPNPNGGGTPSTNTTPVIKPADHTSHYCYPKLSDIQKQYYSAMHSAVLDMHSSWIVLGPLSDNYSADIAVARQAFVADHPEIFWLANNYVTAKGKDSNGNPAALLMFSSADNTTSYLVTRSEKTHMEAELNKAVANIVSKVTATDPFEIEAQLLSLLCEKVTYSADPADPFKYSAYGALVNGRALCEGYSRTMQLLLSQFNIPCTTVTGIANGEGHMWNLVQISNQWYNLDATWSDTANNFVSFEYFNLTDADIALDHAFAKDFSEISPETLSGVSFNITKPSCTATEYNYFSKRGFILTPDNTAELVSYIVSSADKTIEVKFKDQAFANQFKANAEAILTDINTRLAAIAPALPYYIGSYSPSTHTVKLQKTDK